MQASLTGEASAKASTAPKAYKRQNIFDDAPIDVSRLHIGKEEDDAELSALTSSIPDHIRSSILRLTELQIAEAEAEEQAEREEAAVRRERKAAARRTVREVGFEEELEAGADEEGEVVIGRSLRDGAEESEEEAEDVLNRGQSEEDSSVDSNDPETICERQYLISPNIFARTSRKTKQREDLKARTKWSDEQLEGWRTMLERNPRKDRILARHEGTARQNPDRPQQQQRQQMGDANRGRGGGGGGGNHRGGGGRGRGASKSSRGHQNAARTRGHDRKMQRMGAV